MSDNLWRTAFKYHTLGRCVIPSGGGLEGKAALVEWKKFQTERPDPTQLETWERELNPHIWAMPTGMVSGCFVIDCDKPSAIELMKNSGLKPHVKSPKGAHFYCKLPSFSIRNGVGLLPGLDVRGEGGYVNFIGQNGRGSYQVQILPTDDSLIPFEKLPKEIQEALRPKQVKTHTLPIAENIPKGTRNVELTSLAGAMRRKGSTAQEIYIALVKTNERCNPPLAEPELRKIAASVSRYPPEKKEPKPEKTPFDWQAHSIGHEELLKKELTPISYLVENLLVEVGTAVLAAPKKRGKSWMALQLAQCVASGEAFLGMAVRQGPVTYLALEDGEGRLKQRLEMQKARSKLSITYLWEFPALNNKAGIAALSGLIETKKPVLVVIDTLSAAKNKKLDENEAGGVADLFNSLHQLALTNNCLILIIAHHGKQSTGDAGFDIRGSSAISGATDANLGLYKNSDGSIELKAEGRDIGEIDLRISFDAKATWKWKPLGSAQDLRRSESEKRIYDAIESLGGEADVDAIAAEIGIQRATAQTSLKRMRDEGKLTYMDKQIGKIKKIIYRVSPTSSTSLTSSDSQHYQHQSHGVNDVGNRVIKSKSYDDVEDVGDVDKKGKNPDFFLPSGRLVNAQALITQWQEAGSPAIPIPGGRITNLILWFKADDIDLDLLAKAVSYIELHSRARAKH